jgi:hypothetical protein
VLPSLGKPLIDCFKQFYGDTALCGGRAGTVCGLEFYGVDHVLFASDAPFGPEGRAVVLSIVSVFAVQRAPAQRFGEAIYLVACAA